MQVTMVEPEKVVCQAACCDYYDEFVDWMPMTAHLYEEHGPFGVGP